MCWNRPPYDLANLIFIPRCTSEKLHVAPTSVLRKNKYFETFLKYVNVTENNIKVAMMIIIETTEYCYLKLNTVLVF